jgi:hypothetical protein
MNFVVVTKNEAMGLWNAISQNTKGHPVSRCKFRFSHSTVSRGFHNFDFSFVRPFSACSSDSVTPQQRSIMLWC